MRYRIKCTNPQTRQRHEFELDGNSLHDVQQHILRAGLVLTKVMPVSNAPKRSRPSRSQRWATKSVKHPVLKRVLGYTAIAVLFASAVGVAVTQRGEMTPLARLDVSVRFDGAQFTVTNIGKTTWLDVRVDINGGLDHRGYATAPTSFGPGQSMTFDAVAFTNKAGKAYDPATEKPAQLRITCRTADGSKAQYLRRWN